MKKTVLYIWGLATALSLSQCNQKLNEPTPQQSLPFSEALDSPEKIRAAVIGIYGGIRSGSLYGGDLQLSADLLAGGYDMRWRGTFQTYRDIADKVMVAENGIAQSTWVGLYSVINSCNNVLEHIDVVKDENDRNQAKGQALLWRGVCHFELVRLFAQPYVAGAANDGLGVPVITKANDFANVKRVSINEVYTQILADLTQAETLLPTSRSYPDPNAFYATKYAVKGFLARVYMQMGDYANALQRANDIIESGKYSLNATVNQVFDIDNTPEAIFEIQQNITNNAGIANSGLATFYANLVGTGRGDVQIRDEHLDLYEAGDKRLTDLIYRSPEGSNRPGRNTSGKWKNPNKNYNLMRLSEMYLTRAECNQELGSSVGDTPLNDVNRVRMRAGLGGLSTVSLSDILYERHIELCFEGHHIHDLKRRKKATYIIADPADIAYTYDAAELVFPIPRRELNSNPNLQQNPGY